MAQRRSRGLSALNFSAIRDRVAQGGAKIAPLGLYSGVVGLGARTRLPRSLRSPLYQAFSRVVGADTEEAELPLGDYETFEDFFSRRLRDGARSMCPQADSVLAPCDGVVAALGHAKEGLLLQAKGHEYSIGELVMDDELARRLRGGAYATVYLSPRDYHRVHAPVACRLTGYRHIAGDLLPVSPTFLRSVRGLYVRNERVVIETETDGGPLVMVMVAAAGVGNVRLTEPAVDFRGLRARPAGTVEQQVLREPRHLERGSEVGAFLLGSTVVVLFGPDLVDTFSVSLGAVVRQGQQLARLTEAHGKS